MDLGLPKFFWVLTFLKYLRKENKIQVILIVSKVELVKL